MNAFKFGDTVPELVQVSRVGRSRLHTERQVRRPAEYWHPTGIAERFCTAVDCVDIGFLSDGVLDDLPRASRVGAVRVSGIDLNKPRIHAALTAVLALATAPSGFTVGQLVAKAHTTNGPQTQDLDHHRPRLRADPPQHADPPRPPRTHHPGSRGIDKILSIGEAQAPSVACLK